MASQPFDYSSLALSAQTLIDRFGRQLTITVNDSTPADSTKPWRGDGTNSTSKTVMGVIFPAVMEEPDNDEVRLAYSRTLIHGEVRRGDSQVIISALDTGVIDPNLIDTVIDGGVTWHVIKADKIQPGGTLLAYILFIRK